MIVDFINLTLSSEIHMNSDTDSDTDSNTGSDTDIGLDRFLKSNSIKWVPLSQFQGSKYALFRFYKNSQKWLRRSFDTQNGLNWTAMKCPYGSNETHSIELDSRNLLWDISYHEIFWKLYIGFYPEPDGSSCDFGRYRANRLLGSLTRLEICVSRHVPSWLSIGCWV